MGTLTGSRKGLEEEVRGQLLGMRGGRGNGAPDLTKDDMYKCQTTFSGLYNFAITWLSCVVCCT